MTHVPEHVATRKHLGVGYSTHNPREVSLVLRCVGQHSTQQARQAGLPSVAECAGGCSALVPGGNANSGLAQLGGDFWVNGFLKNRLRVLCILLCILCEHTLLLSAAALCLNFLSGIQSINAPCLPPQPGSFPESAGCTYSWEGYLSGLESLINARITKMLESKAFFLYLGTHSIWLV